MVIDSVNHVLIPIMSNLNYQPELIIFIVCFEERRLHVRSVTQKHKERK